MLLWVAIEEKLYGFFYENEAKGNANDIWSGFDVLVFTVN